MSQPGVRSPPASTPAIRSVERYCVSEPAVGIPRRSTLLSQAGADGRQAARQLAQLLRYKTPAQYDPAPLPERDATKAIELARRLVERAAQVNARRRPPS